MSRHAPRPDNLTPIHHVVPPLLFPFPMPLGFLPLPSTSSHLYSFRDGNSLFLHPSFSLYRSPSRFHVFHIFSQEYKFSRATLRVFIPFVRAPFVSLSRFTPSPCLFSPFFLPPVYSRSCIYAHTRTVNLLFRFRYATTSTGCYTLPAIVYLWSRVMRSKEGVEVGGTGARCGSRDASDDDDASDYLGYSRSGWKSDSKHRTLIINSMRFLRLPPWHSR